ncbi:MAG: hypothetical protein JWN87_1937, partial [Frankiales bacterium]|nr:hypothetical protein [Frankiales bacterium]
MASSELEQFARARPANQAPLLPLDLTETLQLVADTIVGSLGFEVAVINLVDDV